MTAPFNEVVGFATTVEREGGILDDLVLEPVASRPDGPPADDVRAQFRLVAVEPADDVKQIIDRMLSAAKTKSAVTAALTLPLEERSPGAPRAMRDPFKFIERRAPKAVAKAGAGTEPATLAPPAPPVPMLVKGIVKFPGGSMAIVNDQIVKVGDLVNGHRVDEIADGRVLLKEPSGAPRAATLPNFATAVPAKDPPGR